MKTILITVALLVGLAEATCAQVSDTRVHVEKSALGSAAVHASMQSFPRIIDSLDIRDGKFFGKEYVVEIVTQRFVVNVPGSEGNPSSKEQRTRDVTVGGSVLYHERIDELVFRTVSGKLVGQVEAVKWIGDNHALLLLPTGHVLSPTAKHLFKEDAIIASPKSGR